MGHTVGDQANRAVKKGVAREQVKETRTPEQILKGIRGNLVARLSVTPNDIQFLLAQYDDARAVIGTLSADVTEKLLVISTQDDTITELNSKLAEFRNVYEQENRSASVTVERTIDSFTPSTPLPESVVSALTSVEGE